MWAVFKLNGEVRLDYCFVAKGGLYYFSNKEDSDGRMKLYLIHEKNIMGLGKKDDLITEFAEHFI